MTYASLLSCSVLMSKFMRASPEVGRGPSRRAVRGWVYPRGRSRNPLGVARRGVAGAARVRGARLGRLGGSQRLLELLDVLRDLGVLRAARVELLELPPRGDGELRVSRVLRCGRELLPPGRILRLDLHDLLVVLDGVLQRGRCLAIELRRPRGQRLRRSGVDGVRAECRREGAGRLERLARVRQLRRLLRVLVIRRVLLRPGELEAAELAPHARILLLQGQIALKRADR